MRAGFFIQVYAGSALALAMLTSTARAADGDEQVRHIRCQFTFRGTTFINGPCDMVHFEGMKNYLQIRETTQPPPTRGAYFISLNIQDMNTVDASWNDPDGESHAHDAIGVMVKRDPSCYRNEIAMLCFRKGIAADTPNEYSSSEASKIPNKVNPNISTELNGSSTGSVGICRSGIPSFMKSFLGSQTGAMVPLLESVGGRLRPDGIYSCSVKITLSQQVAETLEKSPHDQTLSKERMDQLLLDSAKLVTYTMEDQNNGSYIIRFSKNQ